MKIRVLSAVLVLVTVGAAVAIAQEQEEECKQPPSSSANFEDDWIKATAKNGWSSCQPLNRYDPLHRPIDHAGLFLKDDFRLYLLTHTSHASPVPGGRPVEVERYVSPWVDLEEGECAPYTTFARTKVSAKLTRVDIYFDAIHAKKQALEVCGNPESKHVFWYGSYFVENCPPGHAEYDECDSFYITYPRICGRDPQAKDSVQFVSFALTFATNDPDYLPSKGDPELGGILKEAAEIVRQVKYK